MLRRKVCFILFATMFSLIGCSKENPDISEAVELISVPIEPSVIFNYQGNESPAVFTLTNINDIVVAQETFAVVAMSLTETISDQVDIFAYGFLDEEFTPIDSNITRPYEINPFFTLPTDCNSGQRTEEQTADSKTINYLDCIDRLDRIISGTILIKQTKKDIFTIQTSGLNISAGDKDVSVKAVLTVDTEKLRRGTDPEVQHSITADMIIRTTKLPYEIYLSNGVFDLVYNVASHFPDGQAGLGTQVVVQLFEGNLFHGILGSVVFQPWIYAFSSLITNESSQRVLLSTNPFSAGKVISFNVLDEEFLDIANLWTGTTFLELPDYNVAPTIIRIRKSNRDAKEPTKVGLSVDYEDEPAEYVMTHWNFIEKPAGSNSDLVCRFTLCSSAEFYTDIPGVYRIQVVAYDGELYSEPYVYDLVVE